MSMTSPIVSQHAILRMLQKRDIYIWGAGQQGRGIARILQRNGLRLRGFIDTSLQLHGRDALKLPILPPEPLLVQLPAANRPFVIVASFFFEDEIMERCRAYDLVDEVDFISYKRIKPFDYSIDVSGGCNLRCISCPRATRHELHPPVGFMDAATFELVLDKVLREDPFVGNIQLYQWGEPLLNPQLPEMLRIANARGVQCALSSNLNVDRDLGPVIEAGPAWFRVSVSGTTEEYEKTHTGASWDRLSENLHHLSRFRATLNPDMKTEVFYHMYRHNQGESLDTVRGLCERLGFEFHPVWAYLISLDDVLEHLEGGQLTDEARQASNLLALDLEHGMDLARREKEKECLVERCIHINWNLTVSHCMMYFYPRHNIAARNFLETPLAQIEKARNACGLCKRCRSHALHRYCSVYSTEQVFVRKESR
jgi:MoaA/NifB/PqqE/SkfB family radical SAM enzyme